MPRLRIGRHKLNERRSHIFLSVTALLFASLIISVGLLNSRETRIKTLTFASDESALVDRFGSVAMTDPSINFDGIAIFAQISQVNLEKWEFSVYFALFPQVFHFRLTRKGSFRDTSDPTLRNAANIPVTV